MSDGERRAKQNALDVGESVDVEDVDVAWRHERVLDEAGEHVPRLELRWANASKEMISFSDLAKADDTYEE